MQVPEFSHQSEDLSNFVHGPAVSNIFVSEEHDPVHDNSSDQQAYEQTTREPPTPLFDLDLDLPEPSP